MTSHFAGNLGQHGVIFRYLYPEIRIAQHFRDSAL
jgi:hypothetical protein